MKPHEIRTIARTAGQLLERESDPVSAFLLSWVAWEALRTRFLRVVIKRKGWSIKDADGVIRASKISSMSDAAEFMVMLGLKDPSQWKGASGGVWRKLSEVQQIRHRLAHGFAGLNPELVSTAAQFVLGAVNERCWLESMVPAEGAGTEDRNLFAGQPTTPARRDPNELWALIGKQPHQNKASLPSIASLRKANAKLPNLETPHAR